MIDPDSDIMTLPTLHHSAKLHSAPLPHSPDSLLFPHWQFLSRPRSAASAGASSVTNLRVTSPRIALRCDRHGTRTL
eukprot:2814120-Rhodomonas_salina.2